MDYNFDEVIPRRGSNSVKWDLAPNDEVLPMWVADMDFKTAPCVIEALQKRVGHGIFGYTDAPQAYYDAIINWWSRRHNFTIKKGWIISSTGVIAALSATIKALTETGDQVLVLSPVYNHFFDAVENTGREMVCSNLIYQDNYYTIDFNDFEQKAAQPKAKLLLLCNPHNPIGRVWTQQELTRIGEICLKHNVVVVSDEIHSDLVYDDFTHVPFASINEDFLNYSVTLGAPSKTFNLAGLQVGNIISANAAYRKKINEKLNEHETWIISPFAVEALIAAYNNGEGWLEALKKYLWDNYVYLKDFFAAQLPQFKVLPLQATYLVWVDISTVGEQSQKVADNLLKNQKLWVNSGTMYGEAGEGFLRINIACPRALLAEGLNRFKVGFV
ncbi:MalY/PatB family protein [Flavobacterium rhizosphaerae]|uniref:cysteine-S-conjugate beta-lyase n=1 Tax=Flavobacterium rhizosphaerae TaxID=3163298 RepID=A0ABW8YZR6_9FLAO